MNLQNAFLQDIKEHPGDDAPRLILADWLTEQGDPRGEFLRLDVQRLRLDVGDPRRAELRRREEEVLEHHASLWLGPARRHGGTGRLRRGLLHIDVPAETVLGESWAAWGETEEFAWVEALRVRALGGGQLAPLAGRPFLARLALLDLSGNGIDDEGGRALLASPYLARLSALDLTGNDFGLTVTALLRHQFGHRVRLD
jgi:uncharacterized protein (TIGR02996 family)